jgi:RNA polymerase-binding protein DksA
MLTKQFDLEIVRQILVAEHAAAREQIRRDEARLRARLEPSPDQLDLAQEYVSRECRTMLLVQAQQQLEQIEAALQRLDEGTYGLCSVCGTPIAPARLEVLPYACLCVRCQAERERSFQIAQYT